MLIQSVDQSEERVTGAYVRSRDQTHNARQNFGNVGPVPGVDPRLDRSPFWTNSLPSLFRSLIMDPKCDLMYPST
jgi:hypothetical protein